MIWRVFNFMSVLLSIYEYFVNCLDPLLAHSFSLVVKLGVEPSRHFSDTDKIKHQNGYT